MKKINWKLRFQNKTTLVTLITLVLTFVYQILAMCEVVPKVSQDAVMELFMVLINILVVVGVVVDPTTEGVGDSEQALTYSEPKKIEPYKNENEDELQANIKTMNASDYNQKFESLNKNVDLNELEAEDNE